MLRSWTQSKVRNALQRRSYQKAFCKTIHLPLLISMALGFLGQPTLLSSALKSVLQLIAKLRGTDSSVITVIRLYDFFWILALENNTRVLSTLE